MQVTSQANMKHEGKNTKALIVEIVNEGSRLEMKDERICRGALATEAAAVGGISSQAFTPTEE